MGIPWNKKIVDVDILHFQHNITDDDNPLPISPRQVHMHVGQKNANKQNKVLYKYKKYIQKFVFAMKKLCG